MDLRKLQGTGDGPMLSMSDVPRILRVAQGRRKRGKREEVEEEKNYNGRML